jgi:hypothetical protein
MACREAMRLQFALKRTGTRVRILDLGIRRQQCRNDDVSLSFAKTLIYFGNNNLNVRVKMPVRC